MSKADIKTDEVVKEAEHREEGAQQVRLPQVGLK